jgi:hypothetical protein
MRNGFRLPVRIHQGLAEVQVVVEVGRRGLDRLVEVADRVVPRRLVEDAGAEERLREEPGQPREPHDLGVPPSQHVHGAVVARIQLQRAQRLVPHHLRIPHPLARALRERGTSRRHRDHEVPVGPGRVDRDRPVGEIESRGVK